MTLRSLLSYRTILTHAVATTTTFATLLLLFAGGCNTMNKDKNAPAAAKNKVTGPTFGDDVSFLRANEKDVVVLSDNSGQAQLVVSPKMQGRVMTSTTGGNEGPSFGFVNRELIKSGKLLEHINPFGGEDRFWVGPEGGQFSVFFTKGAAFDVDHWQTPAPLDTEAWEVADRSGDRAMFRKTFTLTNYSGTQLNVRVDREVRLLATNEAWNQIQQTPNNKVKVVAFETVNKMSNAGSQPWTKEKGLLSIWILGMFKHSPQTTVAIPIKQGDESTLGKPVIDDYFGKVPSERLTVKDGMVYFKADGQYRSKIGITPQRAKPLLGSYAADTKVLTLVQYNLPSDAPSEPWVNSQWKIQDKPFAGDVANSYNDGPMKPGGKAMGPFYEIETSSPAAALAPGQSITHVHRTIHLVGDEQDLDAIARKTLGVGLEQIKNALPTAASASAQ
jgi:hypothetical protein